jgi:hypothetical protein
MLGSMRSCWSTAHQRSIPNNMLIHTRHDTTGKIATYPHISKGDDANGLGFGLSDYTLENVVDVVETEMGNGNVSVDTQMFPQRDLRK